MTARKSPLAEARRARLQAWIDTRFAGSQADFLRDAAARGYPINQGELSALLRDKSFGEKRAETLEKQAGMPRGYLVTPTNGHDRQSGGAERVSHKRVNEDVAQYSIDPNPDTMHMALQLLAFDEEHGGPYTAPRRTRRLLELYARVKACGGKELSDRENAKFESEVRVREQRKPGDADARVASKGKKEAVR